MKAYVVVTERIHDPGGFEKYKSQVMPTIAAFGGRFLSRGGNLTVVEGEWPMPRLVILEFPSRAQVEAWYRSPEYQRVLPLRKASSTCNFVITDGMPD